MDPPIVWFGGCATGLAIPLFCHSECIDPIDPLLQEERDGRVQGTKEGTIDSKSIHRRNQSNATMDPIQSNTIMWHQTRRISFCGVVRMAHTHSFVSFPTVCVCVCVHGGSVVPCRSLTRRTRRNSKPIPVPAFLSLRCFYDRDVVLCGVVWCQCRVVSMSCGVV